MKKKLKIMCEQQDLPRKLQRSHFQLNGESRHLWKRLWSGLRLQKPKDIFIPHTHPLTREGGVNTSKSPTKRSQHAKATYRNIVGRNMLCAFGHRVAMFCNMLLARISPLSNLSNNTQHVAKRWPNDHKTVAQQCCNMLRLHVAIVWPGA